MNPPNADDPVLTAMLVRKDYRAKGKRRKSLGGCGKAENQEKASRTGGTHRQGKTSDLVANLPQGMEIGRTRE